MSTQFLTHSFPTSVQGTEKSWWVSAFCVKALSGIPAKWNRITLRQFGLNSTLLLRYLKLVSALSKLTRIDTRRISIMDI